MKTKRLVSLLLIIVMAVTLCACGKKNTIAVSVLIDTTAVSDSYAGDLTAGNIGIVEIDENGTVMDALKAYCDKAGLDLNIEGAGADAFVTGIGDLNMGDIAQVDGWVYTVNGEEIWEGATAHTLNEGDSVVWAFMVW